MYKDGWSKCVHRLVNSCMKETTASTNLLNGDVDAEMKLSLMMVVASIGS